MMEDRELLLTVRANIARFGCHIAWVFNEETVWAYSIGVYQTYGRPEICVFGIGFDDAPALINNIVDAIGTDSELQKDVDTADVLTDGHHCILQPVDKQFYPYYFGQAFDFYEGDDFPMLELIWSDALARYPWETDCDDAVRRAQVDLRET